MTWKARFKWVPPWTWLRKKTRPLAWGQAGSFPSPSCPWLCPTLGVSLLTWECPLATVSRLLPQPLPQLPLDAPPELRVCYQQPGELSKKCDLKERFVCGGGFRAIWIKTGGSRYLKYGEACAPSGCIPSTLQNRFPEGRVPEQALQRWGPREGQTALSAPLNATRLFQGRCMKRNTWGNAYASPLPQLEAF